MTVKAEQIVDTKKRFTLSFEIGAGELDALKSVTGTQISVADCVFGTSPSTSKDNAMSILLQIYQALVAMEKR